MGKIGSIVDEGTDWAAVAQDIILADYARDKVDKADEAPVVTAEHTTTYLEK